MTGPNIPARSVVGTDAGAHRYPRSPGRRGRSIVVKTVATRPHVTLWRPDRASGLQADTMSSMSNVQTFELLPIAIVLLACAAFVVAQLLSPDLENLGVRVALGLIPGIIGVGIVLISGFDIVPDDDESALGLISVIVVSALLALGTGYRLARR